MIAWWNQLVTGSPASARATLAAPGVADRIAAELAAAHARWPEATVTDTAFATVLAARLGTQKDPVAALARLRVEDLFLAQWCATGDARAIAAFERVHRGDLDAVLARFRRLAITDDELRQVLRIKLFVAAGERPARIGEYSGFGFLQNWVRVTALRSLLDIARSERARKLEELLADDDLLGMPALGAGVDNRYTREQLSRAIKQAFARAVANLAPRQRNFLRHAHVDSLTLDQIAATYGIHRATVARTLAQARGELMTATRGEFATLLGLPDEQLDSIVRGADSRIDLSLSRVLRAPELRNRVRGGRVTGCPAEDELVRLVEGALGDASLAQLEAHVDRCERCAEVVAGLGALGGRAAGPRMVGRYQLDRRIAAGGMGEVWAAWDPQLRRELAVKLVRPDRADNGVERERLLREARALARLMHPNVLAVHDVGEVDGEVFLATELVAGDTLANRGGASADWRHLVSWYVQAARGLAAAHAAGLVHRDVKPSNLLLGSDGRVRVADFGLAVRSHTPSPLAPTETPSSAGNDPQITAPGMVAGTPAYMAPEQRAGLPADARADQYALCVALAESIAGRRPPTMKSGAQLIEWVAERRPREPALDALCGVLVLGMAIDPADRFPDMTALADALDALDAPARSLALDPTEPALPIAAPPPAPSRRRPMWAIATVATLATTGAVAVYVIARGSGTSTSGAATVASDTATGANPSRGAPGTSGTNPSGPSATSASGTAPRTGSSGTPTWTPPKHGAGAPARALTDVPTGRAAVKHLGTAGTPAPPTTAGGFDFNAIHQAGQVAANHRNVAACQAAVATIPASVPDSAVFAMDLTRATCAMLAGDCNGGRTWAVAAAKAQDIGDADGWAKNWVDEYCPITGDLATRLIRLQAQSGLHGDHVEWCDALVPLARAAKSEVSDVNDRARLAASFENLARGYGIVKQCDTAKALWHEAIAMYEGAELREPDVPNCDLGHAKKLTVPTFPTAAAPVHAAQVDPTLQIDTSPAVAAWIELTQRILDRHDASGCRAQIAKQPATNDPRVLTAHATCEMVADDCDAGEHDLAALLARQGLTPKLVARTTGPFTDAWCPITSDPPTRLRRLFAQAPSASGARCTALLQPARDAAADAATDLQRREASAVLAQLARCLSATQAGCAEARQVIAEAHDLDPKHGIESLTAMCR